MFYFYFTIIVLTLVLVLSTTQLVKLNRLKNAQKQAVKNFQTLHHMSDSELLLFKTEMTEAKAHIVDIEKLVLANQELQQNNELTQTIEQAKSIFKQLMEDPRDLTQFDNFLYRNLPTLHLILNKNSDSSHELSEVLSLACHNIELDFQKLRKERQNEIEVAKEFIR